MTQLECITMENIIDLKCSKEKGSKCINFHAMDDMLNHSVLKKEDNKREPRKPIFAPTSSQCSTRMVKVNRANQNGTLDKKWALATRNPMSKSRMCL